jgi:hypothetical protein
MAAVRNLVGGGGCSAFDEEFCVFVQARSSLLCSIQRIFYFSSPITHLVCVYSHEFRRMYRIKCLDWRAVLMKARLTQGCRSSDDDDDDEATVSAKYVQ